VIAVFMEYNNLMEAHERKKAGRPAKPPEARRSARLQMRTFPDIAEKVARVGTEAVEAAIRQIEEPTEVKTV
jgi:hypothetical protein